MVPRSTTALGFFTETIRLSSSLSFLIHFTRCSFLFESCIFHHRQMEHRFSYVSLFCFDDYTIIWDFPYTVKEWNHDWTLLWGLSFYDILLYYGKLGFNEEMRSYWVDYWNNLHISIWNFNKCRAGSPRSQFTHVFVNILWGRIIICGIR